MIDAKTPCAWTRHLLLTGEAETLQSVSANRREARETAEAKFTLANAVRVAGPDRILFLRGRRNLDPTVTRAS